MPRAARKNDEEMDDEQEQGGASSGYLEDADEDTLRVMVSTDNHVGYLERDPVRGLDSFAAFEEVLYLAKKFKCDMVLIAGDLFHDNKPSRGTLHKTMGIIRRYCMGPDPVQIQIVSDQAMNFRSLNGTVNYEDEFYSVDLPIFSIHGNHDDPTRDGGAGSESLAALDLLAVSNLVNYFGRQDEVDRVEIAPILMKKGTTRVALYGMGSMRDERLNRMWQGKKVRFLKPDPDEEDEAENDDAGDEEGNPGWFNVFALHQNRDTGRGPKNCVHESMIPEWMDLVVWGHEHECVITPKESVVGTFRVTQPGSSVATSLSAGEATRKHVGVLDIRGNQFRLKPVPLTQVRSFLMGDISLQLRQELDPEDPKIDTKVTSVLEEEIGYLIREAQERLKEARAESRGMGNDPKDTEKSIVYKLEKPKSVLVRLKVEHSGFSTLNNQRFGSKFVGQVGNPSDLLLFHRKKEGGSRTGVRKKVGNALDAPIAPAELEEMNIEDLIKENLAVSERKLEILSEDKLSSALDEYVNKDDSKAISEVTSVMLKKQQKELVQRGAEQDDGEKLTSGAAVRQAVLDDAAQAREAESKSKPKSNSTARGSWNVRQGRHEEEDDDDDMDDVVEVEPVKRNGSTRATSSMAKSRATARSTSSKRRVADISKGDEDGDNSDDEEEEMSEERSPAPPARARATGTTRTTTTRQSRAKVNYKQDESDEDDESDAVVSIRDGDDDDDELEVVEEEEDLRKRRQKPTPVSKRKTTKQTELSFSSSKASSQSTARTSATARRRGRKRATRDDDDEDDFGSSYGQQANWGTADTSSYR